MKFPKLRRRDYEEENYPYDEYENDYDAGEGDMNDDVVEDSYSDDGANGSAFEMKIITPKSYDDREGSHIAL